MSDGQTWAAEMQDEIHVDELKRGNEPLYGEKLLGQIRFYICEYPGIMRTNLRDIISHKIKASDLECVLSWLANRGEIERKKVVENLRTCERLFPTDKIENTVLPVSQSREFERELAQLINKYNKENGSNTPDYILAHFLTGCLSMYETAVGNRDNWWNFDPIEHEKVKWHK